MGTGENFDQELFFPSLGSEPNSERKFKKGDYILAVRIDDSLPGRKYMLTESVSEIWEDRSDRN